MSCVVPSKAHRGPGFTLVELLVVVSIIAMLIAILLPTLGAAKYHGKNVSCASRVKSMTAGILTYTTDYRGYYPDGPHGRRNPADIAHGSSLEAYDFRETFRSYFGAEKLHELMMCPLAQDSWPTKYPVYPDIDRYGKSPYAFYFGQDVHEFNDQVGAHWERGEEMLRSSGTWSPLQHNTGMKFDWLMSDFVYYNGYGGFGGTYVATTHRDIYNRSRSIGSYLDHNLGSRYVGSEMGNANFSRSDGSVVNFKKVAEDSIYNSDMIGVRRQSTQSYFVPRQ